MSSISVETLLAAPSKDFLSTRALDRWTSVAPPPMIGEGRADGRWRCGRQKQRRRQQQDTTLFEWWRAVAAGHQSDLVGRTLSQLSRCRASRSKRCSPPRAEIFFRCERSIDRSMQRRDGARPGRKGAHRAKGEAPDRSTDLGRSKKESCGSRRPRDRSITRRAEPDAKRPGFRNATSVKSEKATSIEDRLTWLILPGVYARLKG